MRLLSLYRYFTPYGGGRGMVLRVDTASKAIEAVRQSNSHVVLLSPKGRPYNQNKAQGCCWTVARQMQRSRTASRRTGLHPLRQTYPYQGAGSSRQGDDAPKRTTQPRHRFLRHSLRESFLPRLVGHLHQLRDGGTCI